MLGSVVRSRQAIRFSSAPRPPSWARSRSPMPSRFAWCSCAPTEPLCFDGLLREATAQPRLVFEF
jgi:hypothetical protein